MNMKEMMLGPNERMATSRLWNLLYDNDRGRWILLWKSRSLQCAMLSWTKKECKVNWYP